MAYGRKNEHLEMQLLERVKDYSTLIPGAKYHLRKKLSQDGNVVTDEVHDIILKEFKDDFLVEQDSENKFSVSEFEIFIRKNYE